MKMHDLLLTNAVIVLADRVIERGWVATSAGRIVDIGEGLAPEPGLDFAGDLLMPGIVELHTDHLEAHYMPRPGVHWDPFAAVVSYDAQLATSGITTVLDAVRVWREDTLEEASGRADILSNAIASVREAGLLRAEHFLHLRCELPMPWVVDETEQLLERHDVRLLSLMDHTPGQRQYRDVDKLRIYYRSKKAELTDAELEALFELRRDYHRQNAEPNRRRLIEMAKRRRIPLASHDDTILAHVDEAVRDEMAVAEFPTTMEAAEGLHRANIKVLMGSPNLMRGGSHTGNVATADLAAAGFLDALSSDYLPASLLPAALKLTDNRIGLTLPSAIRTLTKTPAEAVGLGDRGEIAPGKRADLVRVYTKAAVPVARTVWRQGERIA
jgi:alpha-D-ribose 1-methylphosphonate 5-triphosphate diphosphatase